MDPCSPVRNSIAPAKLGYGEQKTESTKNQKEEAGVKCMMERGSRSFKLRYISRNITVRSGTSNRNILELAQWLQSSTSWNKVLRKALDGGSD
jgi:hypothetical protein